MKKIISALFLLTSLILNATEYYVAPNGSDSNPGTISQPWATWQKGFSSVSAGDILYIRGGNYTGMYGTGHGVNISGRDGTSSNYITVSAYPGEKPVLDCASLSASAGVNFGILMRSCDYWNIKGLTVKNVREYNNLHKSAGGSPTAGWEIGSCTNINLESCVVTTCGNGFTLNGTVYKINYINCDAYLNYDYYDSGGLANGFNGNVRTNSTVFYKGCRAWSNSDDGYDDYGGAGYLVYNDCWAYRNGSDCPTSGNGDGFKLGYDNTQTELPGIQRTLYNCISAANTLMGFDESMDEPTSMDMAVYNCIAYKNVRDYGFRFSRTSTGIYTLRNNIAYGNNVNYEGKTSNISDHNTWNSGSPAVSDADFTSLDMAQLLNSRKSDGSLPDITFSRLASGSDLIDAGTNIGLAFSGSAPDLGAFEFSNSVTTPPPATNLAYVSSLVKNTAPAQIEVTYNITIANVTPSTSCFAIKVNSVSRTVNQLAISGKFVYLTLASPVQAGDIVTLSYTKPASNPLQCPAGTIAETISAKSVTNSVEAAAPLYVSSVVENSTPDKIEMLYDTKLANVVPASSSFAPKVNGVSRSVKSVAIVENKVTLTLSTNLSKTDTVTVSYTKPSTNPLQTTTGGKAETLTDKPVINNILGVITDSKDPLINDGKISIFPNPASDFIKIANFDPGDKIPILRIFDFSGKLCQEIKLSDIARMRKIPINLKSGIYVTQLMMGSIVHYVQKLIVVK